MHTKPFHSLALYDSDDIEIVRRRFVVTSDLLNHPNTEHHPHDGLMAGDVLMIAAAGKQGSDFDNVANAIDEMTGLKTLFLWQGGLVVARCSMRCCVVVGCCVVLAFVLA